MKLKSLAFSSLFCFMVLGLSGTLANALVLDRAIIESVTKGTTPPEVLRAIPLPRLGEKIRNDRFGLTQYQLVELLSARSSIVVE